MLKKANGTYKNKYEFPGGKRIKQDKTIQETVKREILEETGLISTIFELIYSIKIDELNLYFYYCKINNDNPIILSKEHTKYIWVTLKQAKKLNLLKPDYTLINFLEKYFDKK